MTVYKVHIQPNRSLPACLNYWLRVFNAYHVSASMNATLQNI